jgi:hypothetical protein
MCNKWTCYINGTPYNCLHYSNRPTWPAATDRTAQNKICLTLRMSGVNRTGQNGIMEFSCMYTHNYQSRGQTFEHFLSGLLAVVLEFKMQGVFFILLLTSVYISFPPQMYTTTILEEYHNYCRRIQAHYQTVDIYFET